MSARTIIENSDDEASDIEQEHVAEQASAPTSVKTGNEDAREAGWNLPPTMQMMFNDHQPNMMFSAGSSTIPNTTWTQRQIALNLEQDAGVPAALDSNALQSQKSKSSLNWSEHLKSQGLESLVRSQSQDVDSQDAAQNYERVGDVLADAHDAVSRGAEDQPSLLPLTESYTPPGTPKLLEISHAHSQDHIFTLPQQSDFTTESRVPDATPGTIEKIMDALARPSTPSQKLADQLKRKSSVVSVDIATENTAKIDHQMLFSKPTTPVQESVTADHKQNQPDAKRQKRSKSGPVLIHVDARDVSKISGDAHKFEVQPKVSYGKEEGVNHCEDVEKALFAPDLTHHAEEILQSEKPRMKKARDRRANESPLQVVVQVPNKVEQCHTPAPVVTSDTKPKKGRGRPKKRIQPVEEPQLPLNAGLECQGDSATIIATTGVDVGDVVQEISDGNRAKQTTAEDCARPTTKTESKSQNVDPAQLITTMDQKTLEPIAPSNKMKASLSTLKSLTPYRVGLSRRNRIPSLLKVVRK